MQALLLCARSLNKGVQRDDVRCAAVSGDRGEAPACRTADGLSRCCCCCAARTDMTMIDDLPCSSRRANLPVATGTYCTLTRNVNLTHDIARTYVRRKCVRLYFKTCENVSG